MKKILLIRDLLEESWPSMDLCADMLELEFRKLKDPGFELHSFQPKYFQCPQLFNRSLARKISLCLSRYILLPRAIRKQRADLYHIIDHSYGHLLHYLPPVKTLVTCHDTEIFNTAESTSTGWMTKKVCRHVCNGLQKARYFACVSQTTAEHLQKKLKSEPELVKVIHNGIAPWFHPDSSPGELDELKVKFNLPENYIIHVGSTVERKNVGFLLDAMKSSEEVLPLVQVGGDVEWLKKEAGKRGLEGRIYGVGKQKNKTLAGLIRHSNALVLPSRNEGFGLPAVEGLACGIPVVVSDIPVFREVLGDQGIYFHLTNKKDLKNILVDKGLTEQNWKKENGNKYLKSAGRFSWNKSSIDVVDTYRLISGH